MTREEALEQLNLTEHSSTQLIRKRYLELHGDYERAMEDAPSDHFRRLYRGNLDKIEEAYLLLRETIPEQTVIEPEPNVLSPHLVKEVQTVKNMVQSFITFRQDHPNATKEEEAALKNEISECITMITSLQEELSSEGGSMEELNVVVAELISLNQPVQNDSLPELPLDPGEKEPELPEESDITPPEVNEPDQERRADGPISSSIQEAQELEELEPTRKNSQLLIRLLSAILILGLAGLTYLYYPLVIKGDQATQTPPVEAVETQNFDRSSVLKIVGDEFYRVDNYVEALIQYTMALSINPGDTYLLQMIDSCRLHLTPEQRKIIDDQLEVKPESRINPNPIAFKEPPTRAQVDSPKNYGITAPDQESSFSNTPLNIERNKASTSSESFQATTPSIATESPENGPSDGVDELMPEAKKSGDGEKFSELDKDHIFHSVDVTPEPIGGYGNFTRYISRTMNYPKYAMRNKISGIVVVKMIINKDGTLSSPEVWKGLGYGCDQEALRVIKGYKGKWKPAIRNREEVNAWVAVPITFKMR